MLPQLGPTTYYGDGVRSDTVAGVHLSERVYTPDYRTPMHAHENAFFYFVLDGHCHEITGRQERASRPFTLVFQPAGERHSNHWPGEGGRCFHIEYAPQWMERIKEAGIGPHQSSAFTGGLPVWLASRLYNEFSHPDWASSLAIEGIALELLAESARGDTTERANPPPWLLQVHDLLHDRFTETLSLDEVAQTAGVHPAHLARAFRRHFGTSIGEYVRKLRVESACRALSSTKRPLLEIALDAGFSDQSHFNRTFKLHTGMTPREYRTHFSGCAPHSKL